MVNCNRMKNQAGVKLENQTVKKGLRSEYWETATKKNK